MEKIKSPYSIDWVKLLNDNGYTVASAERELGITTLSHMIHGSFRMDLDIAIHLLDMCGYDLLLSKREP